MSPYTPFPVTDVARSLLHARTCSVVELCKILDLDSKPTTEDLTSGDLEAKCLVYMTFLQDARKVIADHVELNPDASLAESAESDSTGTLLTRASLS